MEGRRRVIIENVTPEIDHGRFPVKRIIHEKVEVEADIFCDGHDAVRAEILYRSILQNEWTIKEMEYKINDRWKGVFTVRQQAEYTYTLRGWVDKSKTWHHDIITKADAGQDITSETATGIKLIEEVLQSYELMETADKEYLTNITRLYNITDRHLVPMEFILGDELYKILIKYPLRKYVTQYEKELKVRVERPKAAFSAWYEFFPRSLHNSNGHGTFRDCIEHLEYVAGMGFDIIYFPPIHPIGVTKRKGRNNTPEANKGDPGSPWAIGSEEGGHKSIHPQLGTIEEFRLLIRKAAEYNIEIALDIALQCSPDHPYIKEHREWFRHRPDGTIQYAENPPKKYEDIYPFDFECDEWKALWNELKSIFLFWTGQGIRIFRVDNPHTKSLNFWEWVIAEIHKEYPDVIFLSEAFTRPKLMYRLAKLGFTQSYTYFTWRNAKWEIRQYFEDLTKTEVKEFFRPNLWPNTPDILPEFLQVSGRPGFLIRAILAATLSSSWGIYGPAFELMVDNPKNYGAEEYLNSEKYEIIHWNLTNKKSLSVYLRLLNRIRKENVALQNNYSLRFHDIGNDNLIAYSKHTDDFSNIILVIVNIDPHHTHSGLVDFPVENYGMEGTDTYQVQDLLGGSYYLWSSQTNYVELNPGISPGHILRIRRKLRTEQDFDYFM